MVALETTVHDGSVALLGNSLLGNLLIDPVGVSPHVGTDKAKLDGGRSVVSHSLLEGLIEVAVVEEDVRVVEPAVEVTLNRLDGLDDTIQLLVACKDDKGGVGARSLICLSLGVEATVDKNLVMLFANFSANRCQGRTISQCLK